MEERIHLYTRRMLLLTGCYFVLLADAIEIWAAVTHPIIFFFLPIPAAITIALAFQAREDWSKP